MLTVKKVPAATASYADYLEGKTIASSLGDYYLKDGERVEAPGRWVQGAEAVGANPAEKVDGRVLRELMAVRHPSSGEPLRHAGASGEKVAALDATFSAPKSVSAVWAVADPELRTRIEESHETAIDRALTYAARQAPLARQRLDRQTVIPIRVAGLVATSWRHTTARSVDGQLPDPQLHSHVLLHAAVRRDGKLVAIDSRALFTHRRELGAAYRTELARELGGMGFGIVRGTGQGGRYFEIDGVPQALIDVWSSRRRQVQDAIDKRIERKADRLREVIEQGGPDSERASERLADLILTRRLPAAEDRQAALITRDGKRPHTRQDLDRHWHTAGQRLGLDSSQLEHLRGSLREQAQTTSVGAVVEALTEFDATFTSTQARAVALEQNAGCPIHEATGVLAGLRADGELLSLTGGRLTTRRHRQAELDTVESLRTVATTRVPPLPADLVQAEAEALDERLRQSGGTLSDEQRRALQLGTSDRQLVVIEGQAGSGKSTVLQAIGHAHQEWGQHVLVTSTSALAAERLGDELETAGVNALTFSTVALNQAIRSGRLELTDLSTIIHDEAALASTRELRPLLAHAEQTGARLILVGDPHQNHPVGAGGLWPHIEHQAATQDAHVALTRNVRAQHPDDRRDQALFRDVQHTQALQGYAERDRLHWHEDQGSAEDAALEAAHTDRENGLRTLVIAQTSNEHLDELNARVQEIRLQNGELGAEGVLVPGRPYALHFGDEIQIRRNVEVPGAGWLHNGTTGTIDATDPESETVRLQLADERQITLTRDQLAQADIRLAYVQHPFPAQGVTSDTTHLIASDHTTGAGSYVALTRARRRTDLYARREMIGEAAAEREQVEALAARLGRDEPDVASIDLAADVTPRSAQPRHTHPQSMGLNRVRDDGHMSEFLREL